MYMLKKGVIFKRFLVSKVQLSYVETETKQNGERKKLFLLMGEKVTLTCYDTSAVAYLRSSSIT